MRTHALARLVYSAEAGEVCLCCTLYQLRLNTSSVNWSFLQLLMLTDLLFKDERYTVSSSELQFLEGAAGSLHTRVHGLLYCFATSMAACSNESKCPVIYSSEAKCCHRDSSGRSRVLAQLAARAWHRHQLGMAF